MTKVVLVFDGGSRGNPGAGFGNYAIITNGTRTVTRLELGSGLTIHEAEYDTLITALNALVRQGTGELELEIQSTSQIVLKQVHGTWQARDQRMRNRRDRVKDLLNEYKSWSLTRISREQAKRVLGS